MLLLVVSSPWGPARDYTERRATLQSEGYKFASSSASDYMGDLTQGFLFSGFCFFNLLCSQEKQFFHSWNPWINEIINVAYLDHHWLIIGAQMPGV